MLNTERADPRYKGLDTWESGDILEALWQGQVAAVACVQAVLPAIGAAAKAMSSRLKNRGARLVYAGAGSSGLLALQDGMEMTPTYGFPLDRLVLLMAGGDEARLSPIGVAEDDEAAARQDVEDNRLGSDDVVIAVAASGGTPYTVEVAKRARRIGALVIGVANNPDTQLLLNADHPILLDSGAEVIAGSTRLGAGTAQKTALGILSTLTMIQMGHVFDGHMVSVVADNDKLRDRAVRMLVGLTGADPGVANRSLLQSDGSVKLAALSIKGHSPARAQEILDETDGNLRAALAVSS